MNMFSRPETAPAHAVIEILEARIAPATLDVVSGSLSYFASAGIANALTLDLAGGVYTFIDPAETIALGAGALAAGFTGNNTNAVSGPDAAVSGMLVNLNDQNDTFVINGLADGLTAIGSTGTDTFTVAGAIAPAGSLSLGAETLNVNAAITGDALITLQGDALAIGAAVTSPTRIDVDGDTAGRPISLGTEVAGSTSLTDAELDLLTAPLVHVGSSTAGQITVSAILSPNGTDALVLVTAAGVGTSGAGRIGVRNLAVQAVGSVVLDGANDVNGFAANVTGTNSNLSFTDTDGVQITTIDGVVGLTVPTGGSSVITLNAAATSQAVGASISGQSLLLLGAGPFTLTDVANDITTLAASVTGAVSFTDANVVTVGSVSGTNGVTTTNSAINITTVNGSIGISDTRAGADIDAGTGAVTLIAGSVGAAGNQVVNAANAGVAGSGGVTLVAERMSIAALVSGGAGGVVARTFLNTTAINLGGADAAGTLGLTDAELDLLSGFTLTIGGGSTGVLTVSAAISPGLTFALDLIADSMAINQTINVTGIVTLEPATAGLLIDLGTETAGKLSLTDAELDLITATSALRIGNDTAGSLNITAAINAANTSTLSLISGGSIQTFSGSITETNLRVSAGIEVNFIGSNNIGTLAVSAGDLVNFVTGVNPLAIGAVDGVTGVSAANAIITITADSLNVAQAINAGTGIVTLQPLTANRAINLGTATGAFDLTDAELDLVTAGMLRVGRSNAGAINLSSAVSPANVGTLSLITGAGISGAGSIAVANLAVDVAGSITLIGANDVDFFAGKSSNADNGLSFTDADGFILGTVDGIAGISMPVGGIATFNAGPVSQAPGADIATPRLALLGAGPFVLTNAGNATGTLAANTAGALTYTNGGALTIGAAGITFGVLTSAGAITLATIDGALTINDTRAGADVSTGAALVGLSLTAGSAAGQDRALTIAANAGVSSLGAVTFIADNMSISAAVNAGATASLQPFESGTLVNLGAADGANTLGLTDAELDLVAAGVVRIFSGFTGSITISAPIDAAGTNTLTLSTLGDIVNSSGNGITETNLRLTSLATIALSAGQNSVGTLSVFGSGSVSFSNGTTPLTIGVVDLISGISTTNAPITIFANALNIQNEIDAGTGRVLLQTNSVNTNINLGTATGALDLTDAELDRITAGVLEIHTNGGAINLSSAIAPSLTSTLTLFGSTIAGAGSIAVAKLLLVATSTFALGGANDVDFLAASSLTAGAALSFADADGFTLDTVDGITGIDTVPPNPVTLEAGTSTVTFASGKTFTLDLFGATAGTLFDQLTIHGAVNLNGAVLAAQVAFTPAPGTQLKIIDNDGVDAVSGTFAGLAEGALVTLGGRAFNITYQGGDGNDVVLSTPPPLSVTLSVDKKSATYTDVDGDLVTVRASRGLFDGSEFTGIETGANGAGQLQKLTLDADFTGANITITAKRTANGGNGFVNLGFVDATGVDLGAVKIAGDLGRIVAGTTAVIANVPGLKALAVQSIGLLGTSTQAEGGSMISTIQGALPKLAVKGDIRDVELFIRGATDGILGSTTIGGSLVSTQTGGLFLILGEAGIGMMKIGGDVRSNSAALASTIATNAAIGVITIGGSFIADSAAAPVQIRAFGKLTAPTAGLDLAIKSLTVRGSVENAAINVGFTTLGTPQFNADASIGSISVGGDWLASKVAAGTKSGADAKVGTADDAKFDNAGVRDNPDLFSTIGSFTVKGQALGTAGDTTDMFGIVAERVGKAKVGGRTFAFVADKGATLNREAFFAAPTGPGSGTENPAFDFTIREIGSLTPVIVAGGAGLVVTGNTATFTDVDGDLVTVKRSAGAFLETEFTFANTGIGGQLQDLFISAAPDGKPVDVSITARPGPTGGNGFVNVGFLHTDALLDLGKVIIAGDLATLVAGDNDSGTPGVKSLSVHSAGQLGTSTGGPITAFTIGGSLLKLAVGTDLRSMNIAVNSGASLALGTAVIGGSLIGGTDSDSGAIAASTGIGSLKIGGGIRSGTGAGSGAISAGSGAIGALSVGGDLVGTAAHPVLISAFGQIAEPTRGLDLAIKSLSVKGSVENARIIAGVNGPTVNADASIGAISVGRAWLASTVLAGVKAGTDTFEGTADDEKLTLIAGGTLRDRASVFSTIASITIKGQAFGSIAAGDSFGIVVEQIGKAKIGAVVLKFDKGERDAADALAAAPTGPGATGLTSDFIVREIIV